MGLTETECTEKDGKIYDLADTNRKICVLPKAKEEDKKAYLIDWVVWSRYPVG